MQRRNVSMRLLIAVVVLVLPLRSLAQDDEELLEEPIEEYGAGELFEEAPEPDWIPSVKVGVGIDTQVAEATVTADQILSFANRVSFTRTDDNPIDGPAVTGAIEIMGPEIFDGVRPFLTAGLRNQLEAESAVARAQAMGGAQNSRVRLNLEVLQDQWWFAGLGASFQLPIEGYNIKFKPSINYVGLKSEIAGVIIQPVVLTPGSPATNQFMHESRSAVTNHGVSPRVEVDAEVYRQGPISVGLYAELESMILLGGPLQHDLTTDSCFNFGTTVPPCTGTNGASGRGVFSLERSKVIIYGGLGLRVSWMGY